MNKTTVPIKGMHCRSCELLIEDEVSQIPGVVKVEVSEKKACALVYYQNFLNASDVEIAVKKAGYEVGFNEKKPWLSKKVDDYLDIFYALFALFFLYITLEILGVTKLIDASPSKPSNVFTVLLIGLTAGFSTCMALIGGLVLGVSARFSEMKPYATGIEKFKPHLFFNAGRIISYAVLGGVIGVLGSLFQFSGFSLGLMTLTVALVMLTLGMQLTGLFPRLENFKITLPASISKALGIGPKKHQTYSHKNAFIMGATTFFLPCGFTQAMQLYAISTGNFWAGAAIMGVFAIGTAPGLLGIGGLTALVKGLFAQKFFKFAGVVVIALSLYNAQNGLFLLGINPALWFSEKQTQNVLGAETRTNTAIVPKEAGGVQVLKATYTAGNDLIPKEFSVKAGQAVKLEVTAQADGFGCMGSLMIPRFTRPQYFEKGKTMILSFTPAKAGNYPLTCAMGVPWGNIKAS